MSEEIQTITIDGTEYVIDQLSEDHKSIINHIQVADIAVQQMTNRNCNYDYWKTGLY